MGVGGNEYEVPEREAMLKAFQREGRPAQIMGQVRLSFPR